MDIQTLVIIIIGILFLGLIWRVVKSLIRFMFTIGLLFVLGYLVFNMLR